jgi:hypothetical protein
MKSLEIRPEFICATIACREILGISAMTEWRWRNDPDLGFPLSKKIRGRRYYRTDELREWMKGRTDSVTA